MNVAVRQGERLQSPGRVGTRKRDLDTPSLVVDLDVMDRNINRMVEGIIHRGVRWRPHSKAHKSPAIARLQIQAGAIGVTCAKLAEAEVMVAAGIGDVLIANQVVGPIKTARLAALERSGDVIVCVDNESNVRELGAAAVAAGVSIRVLVEVDVGMRRAGVQPGAAVVAVARIVDKTPGLRFSGLMAWESHCLFIANPTEKRQCIDAAIGALSDSADQCRAAGLDVEIVSCGGTGTYKFTAGSPGVTEIEAGGGIFHDYFYAERCHVLDHEFAMTLLATVTSRPTRSRIVIDAGMKALSSDMAKPRVLLPNVASFALSAEHGVIELSEPADTPRVGEKIEVTVGYTDTTIMLHEEIYGIRNDHVETVWPVVGRGKLR